MKRPIPTATRSPYRDEKLTLILPALANPHFLLFASEIRVIFGKSKNRLSSVLAVTEEVNSIEVPWRKPEQVPVETSTMNCAEYFFRSQALFAQNDCQNGQEAALVGGPNGIMHKEVAMEHIRHSLW